MTTAHKDLPALPEEYVNDILTDAAIDANVPPAFMLHHSAVLNNLTRAIIKRAALARPEPASTPVAVESIDAHRLAELLDSYRLNPVDTKQYWRAKITAFIDAHVAAQVDTAVRAYANAAEIDRIRREIDKQMNDLSDFDESKVDPTTLALAKQVVASLAERAAPQGQQSTASGDELCKFCEGAGAQSELVDEASAAMMAFKCAHCSGTGLAKNYPPAKADPAQEAGRDAALLAALRINYDAAKEMGIDTCRWRVSEIDAYVESALKTTPAQPAVDLVAAILALKSDNPHPDDNCGLYSIGFYSGAHAAADLVRAHLKGTP